MSAIVAALLAILDGETFVEPAPQFRPLMRQGGGETSAPPPPAGPVFVSAEIGNVNGSTVAVTFDSACVTPPVVEIKENGVVTANDGGTIQGDPTIVYYVISIPWHGSDDVITVDGNAVTNNITWAALLDLQADTITGVSNGDPLSTWEDQSINGLDFSQAGDSRPLYLTSYAGFPAVHFDSTYQGTPRIKWMDSNNATAINGLDSFCFIGCAKWDAVENFDTMLIDKISWTLDTGWVINQSNTLLSVIVEDGGGGGSNFYGALLVIPDSTTFDIVTAKYISPETAHIYINRDNTGEFFDGITPVGSYSTASTVKIGLSNDVDLNSAYSGWMRSQMVFAPVPPAADIAALEQRLATRYGVTL